MTPLILTLQLDDLAQAFYDDLRHRFFPPHRNLIPAHLTLFHQLPDEEATGQSLAEIAKITPVVSLTSPTAHSLGRGTAVFFQSEPAYSLHRSTATVFRSHLTPQNRQGFRPHITIENKVAPEVALTTLALMETLHLVEAQAIGFALWRYLDGPWKHIENLPFKG